MTGERLFVRSVLTCICLLTSTVFFLPLMVIKIAEGVWLACKITKESIQQVWAARGIPELDK